jgi:hypothetical protein
MPRASTKTTKPLRSSAKRRTTKASSSGPLLERVKRFPRASFVAATVLAVVAVVVIVVANAGTTTIIKEEFASSAANFTTTKGAWSVADGVYRVLPDQPLDPSVGNANYAVHKGSLSGDFTASVDFSVMNTENTYNDATVIFNWTDPNNYMFASFNESANDTTNGIFKFVNGQQTRLVGFTKTFAPGVLRHAQVNRTGSTYTVTVDSVVVGTATDATLKGGRFGLGTRNDIVAFDNFIVNAIDNQAPSVPGAPVKTGGSTTSLTVSWSGSSDNIGVAGYRVYRNNTQVASISTTTYTLTGLTAGTTYAITVAAVDAAGNVSTKSAVANLTTSSAATPTPTPTPTPTGFVHPGIMESRAQLDFVKGRIAAGSQPWKAAFDKAKGSRFGNPGYTPHPVATIDCAANSAGCSAEQDDANAAYTNALLWYYTGNRAHAQASIRILNAWATTLKGSNGDQAHLNHAWAGEVFPRAAEIIRYTYAPASGETPLNVSALTTMFKNVIVPQVAPGTKWAIYSNGNWDLSMTDATLNIAVFTNDRTLFNSTIERWKTRVPTYIYLSSDGASPRAFPGNTSADTAAELKCTWLNMSGSGCTVPSGFAYQNGQVAETCRDISHSMMGLEAMSNAAETAYIQGVDLYGQYQSRIVAAYEFTGKYTAALLGGTAIPKAVCGGKLNMGGTGYTLGWEIALNHYANRKGVSMPYTQAMVNRVRPTSSVLHMNFETLTHAGR